MTIKWKDFVAFLDEIRVKARQHNPKDEVAIDDPVLIDLKVACEKIMLKAFDYHVAETETPDVQVTTTGIARVKTVEESERPYAGNNQPRLTVKPREDKPTPRPPDLEEVITDAEAATFPVEEEQQ